MNRPLLTTALAAVAVSLLAAACGSLPLISKSKSGQKTQPGSFSAVTPLPVRDESVSFHGPGSSKVARGKFPAIRFSADSYLLPEDAGVTLDSVAKHLGDTGASAILAGFTDPEEENRVLGERRALAVRQGLIDRGANPDLIQTVSYGHDLPSSADTSDRRVEFGIVRSSQSLGTAPVAAAR